MEDVMRCIAKNHIAKAMNEIDRAKEIIYELGFRKELKDVEHSLLILSEAIEFKKSR